MHLYHVGVGVQVIVYCCADLWWMVWKLGLIQCWYGVLLYDVVDWCSGLAQVIWSYGCGWLVRGVVVWLMRDRGVMGISVWG